MFRLPEAVDSLPPHNLFQQEETLGTSHPRASPLMDSSHTSRTLGRLVHVVAVPYPGRGHINPMLNLCCILAARGVIVTVVVTEEWLTLLSSSTTPTLPNLRFRSIPDVLPSERTRGADVLGFVQAIQTRMVAPVEELIERLDPPADAMVADSFLRWAAEISERRNIPVSALFTQSATMFLSVHRVGEQSASPMGTWGEGDEWLSYAPGVLAFGQSADFSSDSVREKILWRFREDISWFTAAQSLLFTSFNELESYAIDAIRSKLAVPVYPLATSIPYAKINEKFIMDTSDASAASHYYKWLDSQPRSSVLYVSMGSFLSASSTQIDEIAKGLHLSGAPFLWVVHGESQLMIELGGDKGLVLPWCDQLGVLLHPSIGGFLTHCGWNSTLESVFAGVPMLTFPIMWDQYPNSKLVVDDWKVGLRLKDDRKEESIVSKEEISKTVRKLMDLDADESKELRRRARELKEMCRKSLEPGGSSSTNLDAFIRDALQRPKIKA